VTHTSRLGVLFDNVVAELGERLGPGNVVEHIYDMTGGRAVAEHRAPPVVIWGRGKSTFGAPREDSDDDEPRRLWCKTTEVTLHIWTDGASSDPVTRDDEAEALADRLVEQELAALQSVANTSFRVVDEQPGAANSGWTSLGFALVVTLQINVPVEDFSYATGKATTVAFGPTTPGDGWIG
jgi:hypothetical protein